MLPEQFVQRMKDMLAEEYPAFERSLEGEPYKALRVNTRKCDAMEFPGEAPFSLSPVPWTKNGFYYDPSRQPGKHPLHEAGAYYIQEPSAMAPVPFLEAQPGERILDLCAAPGGKTTQIADEMRGEGILIANEIHPARAKVLSENVERMGVRNCVVTNETPAALAKVLPEFFDRILVDAPCSGEGMFRKNDEAVTEWSPENVTLCGERQDEVLESAARMLRRGGRLVYSTCTFAPVENEGTISRFLYRHPEFELTEVPVPEGFLPGRKDWYDKFGHIGDEDASIPCAEGIEKTMRLMPHFVHGEGHYAAVLTKKAESLVDETEGTRMPGREEKKRNPLNGFEAGIALKTVPEYTDFLKDTMREASFLTEDGKLIRFGDNLYLAPSEIPSLKGLKVLRPGLHLGTLLKKRFEPSHALALALEAMDCNIYLRVNTEDAERFRNGQTLVLDETHPVLSGEGERVENPKGWCLIEHKGFTLGWCKIAGGICKNHFPKGLRR